MFAINLLKYKTINDQSRSPTCIEIIKMWFFKMTKLKNEMYSS